MTHPESDWDTAAVRLLEEALHLRMNGERAPGGTENWPDWDQRAETFLRSLLPAAAVSHVIYCRGCQHAWVDRGASPAALDAALAPGDCACTCTDDSDPLYEAWVTDPAPDDLPAGVWVS